MTHYNLQAPVCAAAVVRPSAASRVRRVLGLLARVLAIALARRAVRRALEWVLAALG